MILLFCSVQRPWWNSMFTDYDFHRKQYLEERFEDLESISLDIWLTNLSMKWLINFQPRVLDILTRQS